MSGTDRPTSYKNVSGGFMILQIRLPDQFQIPIVRISRRILILGFLWNLVSCTGINVLNSPVGPEEMNTNPTPAYGRPSFELWYKGGLIYHNESIPNTITGNAKSVERGESCSRSVLALFAWGDSSIQSAAQKSNIKKIAHIEYEHTAVLGIGYHSFCTIVKGESQTAIKVSEEVKEKKSAATAPVPTPVVDQKESAEGEKE